VFVTGSGNSETPWIDVSVTVRHGMPHWPDIPPPIVLEGAMDPGQGVRAPDSVKVHPLLQITGRES
jgi:hypothetical protein